MLRRLFRLFRGQGDKYTWVDVGSSYLSSDLLSTFLYAELELRETIQSQRARIWSRCFRELGEWVEVRSVRLPFAPADCDQSYHLFYSLLPSEQSRRGLISYLDGISSVSYVPLQISDMERKFGAQPGDCPVTEDVSERLLRLPFYNDMSEDEESWVVETLSTFDCRQRCDSTIPARALSVSVGRG